MKRIATLLAIAGLAGVCSFLTTRAAAPRSPATSVAAPLDRWLGTSPNQQQAIQNADPTFQRDVQSLDQAILGERASLTALVSAPGTTESQALDQVDRLSDAQRQLQKRVISHLLRIRPYLTPDQQKQMSSLYGDCLRGGGNGQGLGRGGMGRGPGPHGYGFGRGRGVPASTTSPQ